MPTHTAWIDPELLLEHQGVQVYCTYKEDDYDQGAKRYWFTVNAQCGELDQLCDDQPCRHVFDVRQLSTWQPPARSWSVSPRRLSRLRSSPAAGGARWWPRLRLRTH